MEPPARPRTDVAFALAGARAAIDRVDRLVEPEHAATEGAFWIASIDEQFGGTTRSGEYVGACEAAGVRALLLGLRYVRNQTSHALVAITTKSHGHRMFRSLLVGKIRPTILWSEDEGLPVGHHRGLFDAYHAVVAGQEVARTLWAATDWLTSQHASTWWALGTAFDRAQAKPTPATAAPLMPQAYRPPTAQDGPAPEPRAR